MLRANLSCTLLAAAAALAAGTLGVPAEGNARDRDIIYADSFGNLVVYSKAGYKRIVVGQGYLAEELNAYSAGESAAPEVVRMENPYRYGAWYDCYRKPKLLKGRSYMYGLADGELPEPSGACER